jgi:hypothetical protein
MQVFVANVCQNYTVTGTTTGTYVDAYEILNAKGAIFNISNQSATQTMYYKITGYISSHASCVATVIKAETSIAAATTIQNTDCVSPYARVVVSVKQNSGAGAYQIDYIAW